MTARTYPDNFRNSHLKNSVDFISTGFEPATFAMPVECSTKNGTLINTNFAVIPIYRALSFLNVKNTKTIYICRQQKTIRDQESSTELCSSLVDCMITNLSLQ